MLTDLSVALSTGSTRVHRSSKLPQRTGSVIIVQRLHASLHTENLKLELSIGFLPQSVSVYIAVLS